MTAAHFQHLPTHLACFLRQARRRLRVAVCWFSHRDLFEVLLEKLRAGVAVELLIEYDSQNIRDGGLDFQQFIRAGGQLYARREVGLMHHKFALVDDALLLSGSFNWTYNSNAENFLATGDPTLVEAFGAEFERLKARGRRIFQVRREEIRVFSAYPLFESTRFQLAGLRQAISAGAGVWLLRLEKYGDARERMFRDNRLPFDRAGLLQPFWNVWRVWNEKGFDADFPVLTAGVSPAAGRDLRRWARRMHMGDLILATWRRQELRAVGIVQSPPRCEEGGALSYREVQWLRRLDAGEPYFLAGPMPAAGLARFRGSALKVLQEVMG